MSIEGKPIGRHMIEAQRMISKVFCAREEDQEARDIGEVAAAMACCIEAEMTLFESLRSVSAEAADALEAKDRRIAELEAAIDGVKLG